MKSVIKNILKSVLGLKKYIITYFVLIVIFMSSITIVSALPNQNIKTNLIKSTQQLYDEGIRFNLFSNRKSLVDGYTDTIIASLQYYVESTSPFKSAMIAPLYDYDGLARYDFYNQPADGNYARYWHGYTVWLRPLLMFNDYAQTRTVLFSVFFFLMFSTLLFLYKKLGKRVTFTFFISMCSVYFVVIPMCWAYMSSYMIMLISILYILYSFKDDSFLVKIPLAFFIFGSLECFFGFLNVSLITYGMPAVLVFLLIRKNNYLKSFAKQIILLIKTGVAWIAGYGFLWFSKWVLVDLFFGTNIISDGIKQTFTRISGETDISITALNLIKLNIDYMFGNNELNINVLFFAILFVLWFFLFIICKKKTNKFETNEPSIIWDILKDFIPIFIIALSPYVWYIVLFNHTVIHYNIISYKLQMITIFAVSSFFLLSIDSERFIQGMHYLKEKLIISNKNRFFTKKGEKL